MTKKLVLVIDDNKSMCQALSLFLETEGFNVICAYDGKQALDLMEQDVPDVIFLDLMMPVLDGWKFRTIVQRQSRFRHIPLIIASATTNFTKTIKRQAHEHFLNKPFDLMKLGDLMRRCIH
jgi:CheY-like chemotaxis protein